MYRHEVFRDLENETLFEGVRSFSQKMRIIRSHLSRIEKIQYKLHQQGWVLEAANIYCDAVNQLCRDLSHVDLESRGFSALRGYLKDYTRSDPFTLLQAETKKLKVGLEAVRYCILIKDGVVKVQRYEGEIDYSPLVEKTFERFAHGSMKDYRVKFSASSGINHVEAQILDGVAKLHPEIFSDLADYCVKNKNFLDETIRRFDREIQFYVAYFEHTVPLKRAELKFCYPQISDAGKEIYSDEGFDLALAHLLIAKGSTVVCNDFYLRDRERILVVTGPNQGGKTTFARTFGQLHYLAALGCPVPGRKARLFLYDRLFTHFEKEEDIQTLRGKLQDDLTRIHRILNRATSNSLIIMNEIFTSTALKEAVSLGEKILERIMRLDCLCVCVTFIEEWTSLSDQTVSMVSTVDPDNPAVRTYKIVRSPADGRSYAVSIAEKYRLTYDVLRERIKS
jgi:DNA mismatch repair ATPase MutS